MKAPPLFADRAEEAGWHQREGAWFFFMGQPDDKNPRDPTRLDLAGWHYRRAREIMEIEPT